MKKAISDKLQAQYIDEKVSDIIDKCSYLDPRFRLTYLTQAEETLSQIDSEAVEIADTLVAPSNAPTTSGPPAKKLKGLASILKKVVTDGPSNQLEPLSSAERVEKEKSRYVGLPSVSPDCDPLEWWRAEAQHLPILAALARKYLCLCGTSVPSERLFSKCGLIVNNLRSSLSPKNVNMLVFFSKKFVLK